MFWDTFMPTNSKFIGFMPWEMTLVDSLLFSQSRLDLIYYFNFVSPYSQLVKNCVVIFMICWRDILRVDILQWCSWVMLQADVHRVWVSSHPHWCCKWVPLPLSILSSILSLFVFLNYCHSYWCQLSFNVVLIDMSLFARDVHHWTFTSHS